VKGNRRALIAAILFTWVMVAASWWAWSTGKGPVAMWLRMGVSVGLILTGVAAGGLRSPYGRAILFGLFCGWWGDFFLSPDGPASFMAGLVAFLIGHVAYCGAFIIRRSRPYLAAAAFLAMLVPGGLLAWWLWPHFPAGLRVPAVVYGLALSAMVALAVGTVPLPGGWLAAVGAVIFYVSDIGVAHMNFVGASRVIALGTVVLYILGQILLASSIAACGAKAEPASPDMGPLART